MDDYQVARQLRGSEWGRDCLIVAVTGYGQDRDRIRSQEAGIDHHLTKPINIDELLMLL